jgi:hypothetical protein
MSDEVRDVVFDDETVVSLDSDLGRGLALEWVSLVFKHGHLSNSA